MLANCLKNITTEASRKEIETLKSWQQEAQDKLFDLEMIIL